MRALRVNNGHLMLANVARPGTTNESLVRVVKSGTCNTDLEIVRGYAAFNGTIGHEFVGVVEESIDRPELVGKRVVGEINAGCGKCALCRSGDPRHCPQRSVLGIVGRDGAHADLLTLPSQNLVEVPKNVSDDEAVFAEPLAAAIGIQEHVPINGNTSVAVVGDGKLGLLCAMAMRLSTPNVLLIGRHQRKLALAKDADVDCALSNEAAKRGREFDVVVEASGSESGFNSAIELVRPRGTIVLKSTFHGNALWPTSRIVVDEITVAGSRCGRIAPALALLLERKIEVTKLIDEEFPLDSGVEAIERASEKGVLKVLLRMTSG